VRKFVLLAVVWSGLASAQMEIHSKHWLHGVPTGAPETNDLIVRDIYALSSNDTTKFADWVAYRLTMHEVGGDLDVERKWRNDPYLDESGTLEGAGSGDDYDGVGDAGIDRGHRAPLASFKGSRYASQAQYMSNITPQRVGLNRGPWKNLEGAVRKLVRTGTTVWVLTGPLYEVPQSGLPSTTESHTVPSGYWKIVCIEKGDSLELAAFILHQDAGQSDDYCSGLVDAGSPVTVDVVEQRSGLDFFRDLPDATEQALESGEGHQNQMMQYLNSPELAAGFQNVVFDMLRANKPPTGSARV
jgi:endonuclease G